MWRRRIRNETCIKMKKGEVVRETHAQAHIHKTYHFADNDLRGRDIDVAQLLVVDGVDILVLIQRRSLMVL